MHVLYIAVQSTKTCLLDTEVTYMNSDWRGGWILPASLNHTTMLFPLNYSGYSQGCSRGNPILKLVYPTSFIFTEYIFKAHTT